MVDIALLYNKYCLCTGGTVSTVFFIYLFNGYYCHFWNLFYCIFHSRISLAQISVLTMDSLLALLSCLGILNGNIGSLDTENII